MKRDKEYGEIYEEKSRKKREIRTLRVNEKRLCKRILIEREREMERGRGI